MHHGEPERVRWPLVSIILPTYNRAKFLPSAFEAIKGQQFQDWELIVVDDGSTDITRKLVADLGRGWTQPVRYVYQENQGAYGARNTGLDLARGKYIAFYDSDDVWLPHHLQHCVAALEINPEVDWVYGATQMVDFASGAVLHPSSFYVHGRPRPFLKLRARTSGRLRIIEDDRAIQYMFLHGLYSGLQCSVIRRDVFTGYRFEALAAGEDQLVVVEALAAGRRFAYFDCVHVIYHIHAQNSSLSGTASSVDKHVHLFRALAAGYEGLRERLRLNWSQTRALNLRLGGVYFWGLGYVLLQQPGHRAEALENLWRGLRLRPWDLRCWKTYLLACLRTALGARADAASPSISTNR